MMKIPESKGNALKRVPSEQREKMAGALIYSPGFDGHRQIWIYVLSQILNELGYKVYIAGNTEQKVSNSFYINELSKWANVEIINTGNFTEGGLKISHAQMRALQDKLSVDLTILPEADHHLELLASQIPKKKKPLRGKVYGIFLRPFYYYQPRGTRDKLRFIKHFQSRWKKDDRFFHEWLLDRFSLMYRALYLDEKYVINHPRRYWIPDMFQQYADMIIQKEEPDQRLWIEKLEKFKLKNKGRFMFLYFGTAQFRRGYDVVMDMALRYDGCFIHCGLQNNKEKYLHNVAEMRTILAERGVLFETNQYIEDPLCVESFFRSATHLILPYRNFFGSSGVMLQALSYGIPVLAPDKGIIGHRIEKYGLGITYSDSNPEGLHSTFVKFRTTKPEQYQQSICNYMSFQTAANLKKTLIEILTGSAVTTRIP